MRWIKSLSGTRRVNLDQAFELAIECNAPADGFVVIAIGSGGEKCAVFQAETTAECQSFIEQVCDLGITPT